MPDQETYLYSPAVTQAGDATFGLASNVTWDSFVRQSYQKATALLQQQANELVRRGNVTLAEARALVEAQRNTLVIAMRQRLSRFGQLYSEILKPAEKLPTLEQLIAKKGSVQAVLTSVGKSRAVVNRFTAAVRLGGSGMVVLQLTFCAIAIASASPEDRERVAAREVSGLGGAAAGAWGGGWAGCAALAAIASPSLVLPIVGEVTTGGACLVGGIAGGFGAGWVGAILGQWAGEATYDFTTNLTWAPQ